MEMKNMSIKSILKALSFWCVIFYGANLHSTDYEEMSYESVEDETFEEIINSEMEDASKEHVVLGLFEFYLGNLEKTVVTVKECLNKASSSDEKCQRLKKICKNSLAFVDSAQKTDQWIMKNISLEEASRSISSTGLNFSKDEKQKLKIYRDKLNRFKNDTNQVCTSKAP